jgi:folate-binding protein YgfZ
MADIITIEGPDAATYLQGQITQDVRPLAVGDRTWTFVLEPTGRVVALASLARTADARFEIGVDDGFGEALLARLARFKLRVKAELSLVSAVREPGEPVVTAADRVARGWPLMGAEIVPGETIPAETGLTGLAVSFTKGCYTGQELVERMDARQAVAPRRLVRVHGPADLEQGAQLAHDGKVVGRVTTAAGPSGLAYVARTVPDGATLDGSVTVEPIAR